jgi:hypothetical protein
MIRSEIPDEIATTGLSALDDTRDLTPATCLPPPLEEWFLGGARNEFEKTSIAFGSIPTYRLFGINRS